MSSHRYHELDGDGDDKHGMPENRHHDQHIGAKRGESHLCGAVDELNRQHPAGKSDVNLGSRSAKPQTRPTPKPTLPPVAGPRGSTLKNVR